MFFIRVTEIYQGIPETVSVFLEFVELLKKYNVSLDAAVCMRSAGQTLFLAGPMPASPAFLILMEGKNGKIIGRENSLEASARRILILKPDVVIVGGPVPKVVLEEFVATIRTERPPYLLVIESPADGGFMSMRPHLSRRESETLADIARGLSTKQIADHLGIGCRTVETYRTALRQKLQANGPADLAMRAVELGIYRP